LPLDSPKIVCFELNKHLQLALLNLKEWAVYRNLSDKRSIEKQAALYVVHEVLQDDKAAISYKESGKPYVLPDVKISISHSYDWLAVLFSYNGTDVGVDIEKVRDKILLVKEKFLSAKEIEDLKNAPLEKYTVYWCMKEAIYKALDIPGLHFSKQICVEDFGYSQMGGKIKANVYDTKSKKNHILHYQVIDNYILVYTENNGA
jgi:4'-phosphopantetheinyl transferase